MKLVTFQVETVLGRFDRVGVLSEDGARVWDANASAAWHLSATGRSQWQARADVEVPSTMIELLATGSDGLSSSTAAIEAARSASVDTHEGRRLWHELDDVRLLAPVPRPPMIRDFLMVTEHVENAFARLPVGKRPPHSLADMYETPGHWKGNPATVLGPDDTVPYPSYTDELDFELELAVVIGKAGRDVSVEDAPHHIAGYTIFNDWSARDIQMNEMKVGLGPGLSKDFAFSIGPCIRTADDFDPVDATLTATIDGQEWSRGTIGAMLRSFPELVSWVSRGQELQPGEIIGGGTIANGCGLELGRYIPPGSVVELAAEGIGRLSNRVGHKGPRSNSSWV